MNDIAEIKLFETWIAKVEVLKQSGISDDDAIVMAYREVYYPETMVTHEETE